tara:strand:+ start:7442 stop:9106 length:1665 start_codon:yes stop_codon:yes gene_type:complete
MKTWNLLLAICMGVLLIQCAQPRPITGGTKDVTPPQIVHSSPQNLTTGFTGSTIAFEFDEYIQVKGLAAEMVVSPPLDRPVEYQIKGKRLFIEIQEKLEDNTTYNFNFGNAIVDLNEGNPLDSNLFVFSTGEVIDSGFVKGIVKDAYTLQPIKNASVVLYDATIDSAVYKGNPAYIGKTDANGAYEINYLAEKKYQIFAIEHPGQDYIYQPFGNVGFYPAEFSPSQTDTIDFFLFKEKDPAQYISKDFSREYFSFVLGFKDVLRHPVFDLKPNEATFVIEELQADSFKFWIANEKDIDSVTVQISDDTGYKDTIAITLFEKDKFFKKLKRKKQTTYPLTLGLNTKSKVHHYFDTLRLNFDRPVKSWKLDSMLLVQGSDTLPVSTLMTKNLLQMKLPTRPKGTSRELRSMDISYKWEISQDYALICYPGAFTDIENQTNDTTVMRFKTLHFEDYGSFLFKVNVPNYSEPLLLELLDTDGKYIRSYYIKSGDVIHHPLAIPGKFKLRLILDRNNNHKWDTGELEKQIQPEEIIYYNGELEIRPNWDMEETWNVKLR